MLSIQNKNPFDKISTSFCAKSILPTLPPHANSGGRLWSSYEVHTSTASNNTWRRPFAGGCRQNDYWISSQFTKLIHQWQSYQLAIKTDKIPRYNLPHTTAPNTVILIGTMWLTWWLIIDLELIKYFRPGHIGPVGENNQGDSSSSHHKRANYAILAPSTPVLQHIWWEYIQVYMS